MTSAASAMAARDIARISKASLELMACPACAGALEAFSVGSEAGIACTDCAARFDVRNGIPNLRVDADQRTEVVREFYSVAPFPGYPPRDSLGSLRARAERSEFARLLDRAIPGDARVLEVGCGTGQMSLFLATANRVVLGADLTRASLELGGAAARRFGVDRVTFVETDLRKPGLRPGAFDVVYCSGVLHHTPDPRASFAALAKLAKPGGTIVLGLYNAYARIPHRLRRALGRLSGFKLIPFDPVLRDRNAEPARRDAWLRDQYLHPEEHRHTTAEVQHWFRENGVEYLRTYPDSLIAAEPLQGDEFFTAADDNWHFENWLAQIRWAGSLWHEGGLWITVGRKVDSRNDCPK
ncbi:class I SAM-dependent methyltransferase [Pendulispora brunnea]|uniref:Class I SAM-dependent methyltransferase n=1 Tax=Pendulispora brunnea TaxID=2905690 RepID=A0ABZ2K0G6_9BACT